MWLPAAQEQVGWAGEGWGRSPWKPCPGGLKGLQPREQLRGVSRGSQLGEQRPAQLHAAVEAGMEEGPRGAFSLHSPGLST